MRFAGTFALKVLKGIDTKSVYLTNSMNVEENVITDPNEIATKCNVYFVNVRPNLAQKYRLILKRNPI